MKHILISVLVISFAFSACKSKKTSEKSSSNEPTETLLGVLKTKVPDATMADLKKGREVFHGPCTQCHRAKDKAVTRLSEERLKQTIDKMAKRAKISDDEKQAVWKYALALNLQAKR